MIELTFADMFLLTWAILATAFALRIHEKEQSHANFVGALIRDKTVREKFFKEMDDHIEELDATLKP